MPYKVYPKSLKADFCGISSFSTLLLLSFAIHCRSCDSHALLLQKWNPFEGRRIYCDGQRILCIKWHSYSIFGICFSPFIMPKVGFHTQIYHATYISSITWYRNVLLRFQHVFRLGILYSWCREEGQRAPKSLLLFFGHFWLVTNRMGI